MTGNKTIVSKDHIIDLQKDITNLISAYLQKYISKLYSKLVGKSKVELRDFLKSIADWKRDKQESEYKKFLKWIKKRYNQDKVKFEHKVTRFYNNVAQLLARHPAPINIVVQDVFAKSMRKVARYYYENCKSVERDSIEHVQELIVTILYSFIPLHKLLLQDDSTTSEYTYHYDNNLGDQTKTRLLVEKGDDTDKANDDVLIHGKSNVNLEYIPSDEIPNEYYSSANEDDNAKGPQDSKHSDIKHIHLPKPKRGNGCFVRYPRPKEPPKNPGTQIDNYFSD